MTGKEYLENIRDKLISGHRQHRKGESLLRAFGYVRRRATAIDEINAALVSLELVSVPRVTVDMPLTKPYIRFALASVDGAATSNAASDPETQVSDEFDSLLQDEEEQDGEEQSTEDDTSDLPEPALRVSELASAKTDITWVSPSASIKTAYTTMLMHKYSQLVVADRQDPLRQDIKGIVSFQSMAKALMDGKPNTVGDCVADAPLVRSDADLKSVVIQLKENDVVLVYGQDDNRLQGIVTAWDLAEEFSELVDPFRRIGEIEERLQTVLSRKLGPARVLEFLSRNQRASSGSRTAEIKELTMGELQRVLEFPEHWDALGLAFDRAVFIKVLNDARGYRNRLMHFGDPLTEAEKTHLTNFCNMVRAIQL